MAKIVLNSRQVCVLFDACEKFSSLITATNEDGKLLIAGLKILLQRLKKAHTPIHEFGQYEGQRIYIFDPLETKLALLALDTQLAVVNTVFNPHITRMPDDPREKLASVIADLEATRAQLTASTLSSK